ATNLRMQAPRTVIRVSDEEREQAVLVLFRARRRRRTPPPIPRWRKHPPNGQRRSIMNNNKIMNFRPTGNHWAGKRGFRGKKSVLYLSIVYPQYVFTNQQLSIPSSA